MKKIAKKVKRTENIGNIFSHKSKDVYVEIGLVDNDVSYIKCIKLHGISRAQKKNEQAMLDECIKTLAQEAPETFMSMFKNLNLNTRAFKIADHYRREQLKTFKEKYEQIKKLFEIEN